MGFRLADPAQVDNWVAERDRALQALTAMTSAATNWASLTPAQKDAAQLASLKATIRLTRLLLFTVDESGPA